LTGQFSEFFPPDYPKSGGLVGYMAEHGDIPELKGKPEDHAFVEVARMAKRLREAWDERDQRVREWRLFELRKDFHTETKPSDYGPPPLTAFEQAMFYFQRNWDTARHCENADCPSPYFFAKSRKPQKYCSPICAGPAKRAAKLRWWNEHPEAHPKGKKGKKSR
jgi:hypothetical protein